MQLNVPNQKFIVTRLIGEDGITSIHIGNTDAGLVAELILYSGHDVEVSRAPFVYLHIPGFGAEELMSDLRVVATPTLNDFFRYSPEWEGVMATDSEWATLLMESVLAVSGGDVHYAEGLDKTRHTLTLFLHDHPDMCGTRADKFSAALHNAMLTFDKRMAATWRTSDGPTGEPRPDAYNGPAEPPRS